MLWRIIDEVLKGVVRSDTVLSADSQEFRCGTKPGGSTSDAKLIPRIELNRFFETWSSLNEGASKPAVYEGLKVPKRNSLPRKAFFAERTPNPAASVWIILSQQ